MGLQNPFPLFYISSKYKHNINNHRVRINNAIEKTKMKNEKLPGEERNEFVTMSGESTLYSVSDTGKSCKLRLRHGDEREKFGEMRMMPC